MPRATPPEAGARVQTVDASDRVKASVRAVVIGQMAGHLRLHGIDLNDKSEVWAALSEAGFGTASIDALGDLAIEAAR